MIAFIGRKGSVVAGDMREITLQGPSVPTDMLEQELYSGQITTDEALLLRAHELGIHLRIRDTKKKVRERDGILIGEITDFERGVLRRRRLYVTTGRFALADIEGAEMTITQTGEGSKFVVLGNDITKRITYILLQEQWKNGSLADAIRIISDIMGTISQSTASVSRDYLLIETASIVDLEGVIDHDRTSIL